MEDTTHTFWLVFLPGHGVLVVCVRTRLHGCCNCTASWWLRHSFQSLHHSFGTHCHPTSKHPLLCMPLVNVWKHFFIASLFLTFSRPRGLRSSFAILVTLKIFDW